MKETYNWVPWFQSLAKSIAENENTDLIEKAKRVNWIDDQPRLLRFGHENIDPLSFFYFLAQKNTRNQRKIVYSSVHEVFGMGGELPEPAEGSGFYLPTPFARSNSLFHYNEFNPDLLWTLFRQAVPGQLETIAGNFEDALNMKGVGVPKLTQCLFLINPKCFLPFEALYPDYNYNDKALKKKIEDNGWNAYSEAMAVTRSFFPECEDYALDRVLYHLRNGEIAVGKNFFQVSTEVDGLDHWQEFRDHHWVRVGEEYPDLAKPGRGDIILARSGRENGKGIGIVWKNDYHPGGYYPEGRVHVLWINKSENTLRGRTEPIGFSPVSQEGETCQAFYNTPAYRCSFELIDKFKATPDESDPRPDSSYQGKEAETMKHPLNQILYGPPGTGKTWHTVSHAVAILGNRDVETVKRENRDDTKRQFEKFRNSGQIEVVTFHQNYAYEDFIEGIRPVLGTKQSGSTDDIRYELSEGIFKEIASRAKENRTQGGSTKSYVLIIDEINRGNIAKIFGELITLIEPSKRLGKDDEASLTLPYSRVSFGVPDNLYIIGTMNTADRSTALIDTALRRRFEFVEMMPDPGNENIKTDIEGIDCQQLLGTMNNRIHVLRDREHQIGHTYFIEVDNMDSLVSTFQNKIIPLLQEYFYEDWKKIDLVLNRNGFISGKKVMEGLFENSDEVDTERRIYEVLPAKDSRWHDPECYIAIYRKPQTGNEPADSTD